MAAIKCKEGASEIRKIRGGDPTNYAVWYVKKIKKKNVLKFQESGPGGLAEVRAALDPTKVS